MTAEVSAKAHQPHLNPSQLMMEVHDDGRPFNVLDEVKALFGPVMSPAIEPFVFRCGLMSYDMNALHNYFEQNSAFLFRELSISLGERVLYPAINDALHDILVLTHGANTMNIVSALQLYPPQALFHGILSPVTLSKMVTLATTPRSFPTSPTSPYTPNSAATMEAPYRSHDHQSNSAQEFTMSMSHSADMDGGEAATLPRREASFRSSGRVVAPPMPLFVEDNGRRNGNTPLKEEQKSWADDIEQQELGEPTSVSEKLKMLIQLHSPPRKAIGESATSARKIECEKEFELFLNQNGLEVLAMPLKGYSLPRLLVLEGKELEDELKLRVTSRSLRTDLINALAALPPKVREDARRRANSESPKTASGAQTPIAASEAHTEFLVRGAAAVSTEKVKETLRPHATIIEARRDSADTDLIHVVVSHFDREMAVMKQILCNQSVLKISRVTPPSSKRHVPRDVPMELPQPHSMRAKNKDKPEASSPLKSPVAIKIPAPRHEEDFQHLQQRGGESEDLGHNRIRTSNPVVTRRNGDSDATHGERQHSRHTTTTSTSSTRKAPQDYSQVCKYYNSKEGCMRGRDCMFVHQQQQQPQASQPRHGASHNGARSKYEEY